MTDELVRSARVLLPPLCSRAPQPVFWRCRGAIEGAEPGVSDGLKRPFLLNEREVAYDGGPSITAAIPADMGILDASTLVSRAAPKDARLSGAPMHANTGLRRVLGTFRG